MAGTVTLANFTNNVYRRANEATNTTFGDLQTGTGSAPTITTATTVQDYLQQAIGALCRSCLPLRGRYTIAAVLANTRMVRVQDFVPDATAVPVPPTSSIPWRIVEEGVIVGTVRCPLKDEDDIASYYPDYLTGAAGTVKYVYRVGSQSLGFYPFPSGSVACAASFLYVPAVVASGAMLPDVPDDITNRVLEPVTTVLVIIKQAQDPNLAVRVQPLLDIANEGQAALWRDMDDYMRNVYYGNVPPALLTVDGMAAMAGVRGGGG
jgi:hypothetical protein